MAKSYFYDEGISDWRELVKGEQGERGPVGPIGPQGPAIDIETGLPISVDTSVGTRVFVGDTMIYGDTGWRDISNLLNEEWEVTRGFLMRRENSTITLVASIRRASDAPERQLNQQIDLLNTENSRLPQGFRPYRIYGYYGFATTYQGVALSLTAVGHRDNLQLRSLAAPPSATILPGAALWFTTYWQADDDWPETLPGTPA